MSHAVQQAADGETRDFEFLTRWDAVAVSKWPLAYRADGRNWRNWVRGDGKVDCPVSRKMRQIQPPVGWPPEGLEDL